jgi:hypothetical protein
LLLRRKLLRNKKDKMRRIIYELPLDVVNIREEGYHVFLDIRVNNKPARMLLDTGASHTVFDIGALKQMYSGIELHENEDKATGLGSNSVENFIAEISLLNLGGLRIADYQVGVMDLSHVNEKYRNIGLPIIAGVLGSDILMEYKSIINYGSGVLTLFK